jgi:hypothetical protein
MIGVPNAPGCNRMPKNEIIELSDLIAVGVKVFIGDEVYLP